MRARFPTRLNARFPMYLTEKITYLAFFIKAPWRESVRARFCPDVRTLTLFEWHLNN